MTIAHAIVMLLMMAGLYALTLPIELQKKRWLRLLASFPPVYLLSSFVNLTAASGRVAVAFSVVLALFCFLILALLWRGHMAHLLAVKATNILYGDGRGGGGFRPDYRHAETLIKEGKLKEALKELEEELSKSQADYPGRMLHAAVQCELKNPAAALQSIDMVLRSTSLTPQQRREASRARREAEMVKLRLDDERQRGIS